MQVAAAGDVDNDGVQDLLLGAQYEDTTAENVGTVYLIYGAY